MTMKHDRIRHFQDDECGATAVEFALVAPVFLAAVFGVIQLSVLALTVASLNYAVEKGARCAAVRTGCADPKTHYYAPGPAPLFTTSSTQACGLSLTATVTYNLNIVAFQKSIALSETACFPDVKSGA
jgi:Flp pilus assembly protein TadG